MIEEQKRLEKKEQDIKKRAGDLDEQVGKECREGRKKNER